MLSLTTHYPLRQSHLQSRCTPLQCVERGWWPRRTPPAPSCSAPPAALGLSSTGSLLKTNVVCAAHFHLNHRQQQQKKVQTYADGRQQVAPRISSRLRLSSAAVVPCYRRGSSCGRERWRWGTWGRWDRWQGVSGA